MKPVTSYQDRWLDPPEPSELEEREAELAADTPGTTEQYAPPEAFGFDPFDVEVVPAVSHIPAPILLAMLRGDSHVTINLHDYPYRDIPAIPGHWEGVSLDDGFQAAWYVVDLDHGYAAFWPADEDTREEVAA